MEHFAYLLVGNFFFSNLVHVYFEYSSGASVQKYIKFVEGRFFDSPGFATPQ